MKKSNVIKSLLIVTLVLMICLMSNLSYATSVEDLARQQGYIAGGNEEVQQIRDESNTNQISQVPTTSSTPANTTSTNKITTNTTLPKTGVDNTAMWVLIAVSAVAAIYTYKKVRDYNA